MASRSPSRQASFVTIDQCSGDMATSSGVKPRLPASGRDLEIDSNVNTCNQGHLNLSQFLNCYT